MSLFSWLRARLSNSPTPHRSPRRPATRRFRPRLEALEGRAMLSTLTVLNNADSGHGSLRAEISAAQSGDTIVFAPSLNGQTIALSGGELSITKGLNIEGPGAGELTISGIASVGGINYLSRVFEVNASQSVSISGLSIVDGRGGPNGGAILNHSTLTLSNCEIENSTAEYGGAIDNASTGTLTISGCGIYNNHALDLGGGIRNLGTMTVSGSNVGYNYANADGGGIDNQGRLNVSTSTLSQNSTYGDGGGIYSWVGSAGVTLTGCTLSNNRATVGQSDPWGGTVYGGGALYVSNYTTATLTNCTLASNTATDGYGGGIDVVANGRATLLNCTLALNSAGHGGGIASNAAFTLGLTNTIVAENLATTHIGPDIYGAVTTADHNLVGNGAGETGIVNGVNGDIVGVNPMLGPLANNGGPTETMALLVGSPAIGQADNAAAPATDQRGVTRQDVPGEATDIGAFEF